MQKFSKQREQIRLAVKQSYEHPTAEEVYLLVKEIVPNISLGTVYRNLNMLAQHGIILKLPFPDGAVRFDGRLDNHYHAVCSECGKVWDWDYDTNDIATHLYEQTGMTLNSITLSVSATCEECRKKENLHE